MIYYILPLHYKCLYTMISLWNISPRWVPSTMHFSVVVVHWHISLSSIHLSMDMIIYTKIPLWSVEPWRRWACFISDKNWSVVQWYFLGVLSILHCSLMSAVRWASRVRHWKQKFESNIRIQNVLEGKVLWYYYWKNH